MLEYLRKEFPMLAGISMWCGLALVSMTTVGMAQSPSPTNVKTLNPVGAISTGTDAWSVGARAGDFIFIAGMQGIMATINWSMETRRAFVKLF